MITNAKIGPCHCHFGAHAEMTDSAVFLGRTVSSKHMMLRLFVVVN